jgi:hypothetical protein
MKMQDLLFYTRGWAKPVYHMKSGDKIQLVHGPGLITKVVTNKRGLMKIFFKREGHIHGFTPSSRIYGPRATRTDYFLMIHD